VSVPSAREGVGKREFPVEESSESELAKTSVENPRFSRRSAPSATMPQGTKGRQVDAPNEKSPEGDFSLTLSRKFRTRTTLLANSLLP